MIRLFFILTISWGNIRALQPSISLESCESSNLISTTKSGTMRLSLNFNVTLLLSTKKNIPLDKIISSVIIQCSPTKSVSKRPLLLPSIHKNHSTNLKFYFNTYTNCQYHGLDLEEMIKKFGLIQNEHGHQTGKEIYFIENPMGIGDIRKVLKEMVSTDPPKTLSKTNYLKKHLESLNWYINREIDKNFSGLGVIDYLYYGTAWMNWLRLDFDLDEMYEKETIDSNKFPFLANITIRRLAYKGIEEFRRLFMEQTIKVFKKLRPKAIWGYYGFPFCNIHSRGLGGVECNKRFEGVHDNMEEVWNQTDVLLPAIFVKENLNFDETMEVIDEQLDEARRIANKYSPPKKIFPVFWYKYPNTKIYVTRTQLDYIFQEMIDRGVDGFICQSFRNEDTGRATCRGLDQFLKYSLGPTVQKILNYGSQ